MVSVSFGRVVSVLSLFLFLFFLFFFFFWHNDSDRQGPVSPGNVRARTQRNKRRAAVICDRRNCSATISRHSVMHRCGKRLMTQLLRSPTRAISERVTSRIPAKTRASSYAKRKKIDLNHTNSSKSSQRCNSKIVQNSWRLLSQIDVAQRWDVLAFKEG